jgi:hypothetical protein
MKRLYILILILLICLAFTACKRKQDSSIQLDNNSSNSESENVKYTGESEAVDDGEYNPNEIISNGTNNNVEKTLDVDIGNVDGKEDIISGSEFGIYYFVIGDVVRFREDASLVSNTLDLLSMGSRVECIDREGEWIKVKYDDKIGYIRNDLLSETEPLEEASEEVIVEANNPIEDIDDPKIIVKKADRILQLWDGDTLKASYPIGLGWEPVGDKEKEGDGKTPEGTYYVCTRNNVSRFYLSLGLSYPNKEDADEGLEADLIDQSTYNQIEDAINREVQPPWNTALGGEIMIHGHGSHSDWTAGCIAVDDDIMDILWEHCRMGTPVIIEP